jgi:hypothetical protein
LPISTILSDINDHNHVIQTKIIGLSGRHHFIAVLQKSPRKSMCDTVHYLAKDHMLVSDRHMIQIKSVM